MKNCSRLLSSEPHEKRIVFQTVPDWAWGPQDKLQHWGYQLVELCGPPHFSPNCFLWIYVFIVFHLEICLWKSLIANMKHLQKAWTKRSGSRNAQTNWGQSRLRRAPARWGGGVGRVGSCLSAFQAHLGLSVEFRKMVRVGSTESRTPGISCFRVWKPRCGQKGFLPPKYSKCSL